MKPTLLPGLEGTFRYRVPPSKTVPRIYEEAPDFQMMPAVFATGYLVALAEWACIELVKPHLDWPREQSLGTRVDLSHVAATPPGLTIEVRVRLAEVDGRKLVFDVSAHDGSTRQYRHARAPRRRRRFARKVATKAAGRAGMRLTRPRAGARLPPRPGNARAARPAARAPDRRVARGAPAGVRRSASREERAYPMPRTARCSPTADLPKRSAATITVR